MPLNFIYINEAIVIKQPGIDNRYQSLPANHKTLLQVMSVNYSPLKIMNYPSF